MTVAVTRMTKRKIQTSHEFITVIAIIALTSKLSPTLPLSKIRS